MTPQTPSPPTGLKEASAAPVARACFQQPAVGQPGHRRHHHVPEGMFFEVARRLPGVSSPNTTSPRV